MRKNIYDKVKARVPQSRFVEAMESKKNNTPINSAIDESIFTTQNILYQAKNFTYNQGNSLKKKTFLNLQKHQK